MNILHLSTYDTGGAAVSAIRLHTGLLEKGFNSRFLSLFKKNHAIPEATSLQPICATASQRILNRIGLPQLELQRFWNAVKHHPRDYETLSSPNTDYAELAHHTMVNDADIINLHFVANFLDYPSFFSKVRKPIVWTLHDMVPIQGIFHYGHDKYRNRDSLGELDAESELQKVKCMRQRPDVKVVCPSQWMEKQTRSSPVFHNHEVRLIPYGLPTDIFRPVDKGTACSKFKLNPSKRHILFVSERISNYRKGFDILLDAIRHFKTEHVDFVAIGDKEQSLDKTTDRIRFLGSIRREEDMAKAYSLADVFVLPSREDNLPNTMLEALACGTPVVGFDVGGIPDAVREHENGILCTAGNSHSLLEGIESALHMTFNRESISERCHERYALTIQAEEYAHLYEDLLHSHPSRHAS
jgi:glycosyltransferase involved in cell wall biosynthesis